MNMLADPNPQRKGPISLHKTQELISDGLILCSVTIDLLSFENDRNNSPVEGRQSFRIVILRMQFDQRLTKPCKRVIQRI